MKINTIIKKISFDSDGFLLKGFLHLPEINQPPVVVGSHGLFSSSSSPKQTELARKCAAQGIAFFRFDHRGCGASEGAFKDVTSLEARCSDLVNAVKMLRAGNNTKNQIGLFGSSLGGAVCLSAANELSADAIVVFAAPVRSKTIIETLKRTGEINGASFDKKRFWFDISDKLSNIRNVLIFQGDADNLVPTANAREIYQMARRPKRLILQNQGDHLMSDKKHQHQFIKESVFWYRNLFDRITTTENQPKMV